MRYIIESLLPYFTTSLSFQLLHWHGDIFGFHATLPQQEPQKTNNTHEL